MKTLHCLTTIMVDKLLHLNSKIAHFEDFLTDELREKIETAEA
jgi:hypothetical protein